MGVRGPREDNEERFDRVSGCSRAGAMIEDAVDRMKTEAGDVRVRVAGKMVGGE
jgi:hypothetical protein